MRRKDELPKHHTTQQAYKVCVEITTEFFWHSICTPSALTGDDELLGKEKNELLVKDNRQLFRAGARELSLSLSRSLRKKQTLCRMMQDFKVKSASQRLHPHGTSDSTKRIPHSALHSELNDIHGCQKLMTERDRNKSRIVARPPTKDFNIKDGVNTHSLREHILETTLAFLRSSKEQGKNHTNTLTHKHTHIQPTYTLL